MTSNGTTWTSAAISAGGMTLLGTITVTAANSVSLGSLNLTSYKSLFIALNNLQPGGNTIWISSNNRQSGGGFVIEVGNSSSGIALIDLGTGALGGGGVIANNMSSAYNPANTCAGLTNVTTSTTTIYFRIRDTSVFVAQGSILIYGVK